MANWLSDVCCLPVGNDATFKLPYDAIHKTAYPGIVGTHLGHLFRRVMPQQQTLSFGWQSITVLPQDRHASVLLIRHNIGKLLDAASQAGTAIQKKASTTVLASGCLPNASFNHPFIITNATDSAD